MKKFLFLISTILLFSILVACISNEPLSTNNSDMIATIVAETLSAIPTFTPTPVPSATVTPMPTDTLVVDEWTWHNIDLYGLKLKLPPDWIVTEVNRKPEPTRPGDPITGHDCAEYQLTSADNLSVLSLRPTCGFAEGFPGSYPPDTVIINRQKEKFNIGRYFTDGKFIYANTYLLTYSDSTGEHQEMVCLSPPTVSFTKKEGFIMASIDFQYLGSETNINQILTRADEIVLSISEQ